MVQHRIGSGGTYILERFSRLIGVRRNNGYLVRFLGLRELAAGVGILQQPKYPAWIWSRVAGDVMDLALLVTAFASKRNEKGKLLLATTGVIGATALDLICSEKLTLARKVGGGDGVQDGLLRVKKSITINKGQEELYRFWRQLENLPKIMYHLEAVKERDEKRSFWKAKGPMGKRVEWEAEIVDDRPHELIAWRSMPGSEVYNSGVVRFEPATGGRGTVVRVEMVYGPPGGTLGLAVAQTFQKAPGSEVAGCTEVLQAVDGNRRNPDHERAVCRAEAEHIEEI